MPFTDNEYYKAELAMGISFENATYVQMMRDVYDRIMNTFHPKSVLEIGAGMGVLGSHFTANRELYYLGIEPNIYHVNEACRHSVALIHPDTFMADVPQAYDIVICIEVFEHLKMKQIMDYLNALQESPLWIFSSTSELTNPAFDEQWGHINVLDPDDWIHLFHGFGYRLGTVWDVPTKNTMIFQKNDGHDQA